MIRNHNLNLEYQKNKTLFDQNPIEVIPKIENVINILNSYYTSEGKKLNENNNNFYYKHNISSEVYALHINYENINIKGSKGKKIYRADSFYPKEDLDLTKYKLSKLRYDFFLYEQK